MAPIEQIEVELKFDVDATTAPPDLRALPGVVSARPPQTFSLDATYFDTENLDLATNRITLRRRTGGHDGGWHLKRPAGGGARTEMQIAFDEAPADDGVPPQLLTPVLALTRNRTLVPVAAISTTRTIKTLLGEGDQPIAEFADDAVTAQSLMPGGQIQQWNEWEFELLGQTGNTKLLKAAQKLLRASGGREPSSASKLARAIGSTPALAAPHIGKHPTALELVVTDIAIHRNSLIAYDPLVRVDAPDAVHQMRVATRRLRSVFSGFPTVLDTSRTDFINSELQLLARILGEARDSEVQLAIDSSILAGENASPELVAALTGSESNVHDRAIAAAHAAMSSTRYFRLLDAIDELIAAPPAGPDADLPADKAVDKAIAKNRKKIKAAQAELAALREGSDEWQEQLHVIRKRAKKLRYSTDAAAPLGNKKHRAIAKAAKSIQSTLGDVHDIHINRAHIAELAASGTLSPADAFVLGRIDARQQADAARAVDAYRRAAADL